ncbi:dihydrolipoamide acetyltransferase component of pyruvate dehydrogenase complex [Pilimelia terevasa]|uniref:Dihydrolipoamide acetyltransferase component of pyruvate dehydrogenase complex n=1 Tax=Pilimelia terevasa TaxID=53372 RepID=A0A8J3FJ61_9ACTN|nr:dihydrolipoamide acetyltransferase family protein [Pilimelia terevasa]GGK35234.1 dihydrolipoamide acetyltransferase component of pyruvate dehydrogenase complex [Pilimelia terevasa]
MSRIKEFPLPDLAEGLTEGEILTWYVKVGDAIALNQPMVEVETAKAAVEIPAKWAGRVHAIHFPEGTTVEVGTSIIAIDTEPDGAPLEAPATADAPLDAAPAPAGQGFQEPGTTTPAASAGGRSAGYAGTGFSEPGLTAQEPDTGGPMLVGTGPKIGSTKRRARKGGTPAVAAAPVPAAAPVAAPPVAAPTRPAAPPAGPAANGTGVLAKPPVRKLAKDLGVDLRGLTGSGPRGSITRDDVQAALAGVSAAPASLPAAAATAPSFGPDREQRIPVKGVRKLTAENMVSSAFTAPHVTEFLTVDVTRAMAALDRLKARRDWRDVRVSPLLLVAKAMLMAAARNPMVNATFTDSEIIVKEYVNLGIAAATPRGLMVPNVKDAGRLSLRELADALNDLVRTAKDGKTAPADMSGGTMTITNVGVFGVDTGTPILPPGESAILCLGAIRDMPWVHEGEIAIRKVTTLGLSFDHRIIDGELGSMFLRDIGEFLADPEAALLAWG